ncbi:MAG: CBS domain-containing protein [Peptostreptococcales bacterium]|jgi:CBS domain-containing protein
MKVREIMSKSVIYAKSNTSLENIANMMKERNVGSIPICDENQNIVGIVTDRDIVLRGVSNGNQNLTAKDVMTKDIVSVRPDMDTREAADLMAKNQIRRLPVVEGNKLEGMLAVGDIAVRSIYHDETADAMNAISKNNYFN